MRTLRKISIKAFQLYLGGDLGSAAEEEEEVPLPVVVTDTMILTMFGLPKKKKVMSESI